MLTRTIFAVVLFAVLKCCHAQPLPVISVKLQSAANLPIPLQIPGLAEWWSYTNSLATNATVTNWYGIVQNTLSTNGNAANRPTNSASGMFFGTDTKALTNTVINIGSNFSVVAFINKATQGYEATIESLCGDNSGIFNIGFLSGAASTVIFGAFADGVSLSVAGHNLSLNRDYDVTLVSSNNAGGGTYFFYTNAFLLGNSGGAHNVNKFFGAIGEPLAWSPNNYASVFVRDIFVYTNVITPLQISNLHYYRTNLYGSP